MNDRLFFVYGEIYCILVSVINVALLPSQHTMSSKGKTFKAIFSLIKFSITILFVFIFCGNSIAQQKEYEDFVNKFKQAATASEKEKIIIDVFEKYLGSPDTISAAKYQRYGLQLSQLYGESYFTGYLEAKKFLEAPLYANSDSVQFYYGQALEKLYASNRKDLVVKLKHRMGSYLLQKQDAKELLTVSDEGIKESIANKQYDYTSLFYTYKYYLYATLKVGDALPFTDSIIKYGALSNKASLYSSGLGYKADALERIAKYDSAEVYYNKAVSYLEEHNDTSEWLQSKKLFNSYTSLFNFYLTRKNIQKLTVLREKMNIAVSNAWDRDKFIYETVLMGDFYALKKDYNKAIHLYNQYLNSPIIHNEAPVNLLESYSNLTHYYSSVGNYAKAYSSQLKVDSLNKLLSAEDKINALRDKEHEYAEEIQQAKLQKKESELQKNTVLLQQQQLVRNFLIVGIAILLLVTIIIIWNLRRIRKLKAQAEQSEKFKQQFLANMSHEIRSPMNAALGAVELATHENNNPKTKEYLDTAQRSTKKLLRIINDVLDLSKIEAGKLIFEKEIFFMEEAVNDIVNPLRLLAMKKNIGLNVNWDEKAKVAVKGDVVRFSQVLNNLLNNSVKFTERGNVSLKVSFGNKITERIKNNGHLYFQFIISDTGIGMTPEQVQNLFQTYTQATVGTTRKYGGSGLGLSITKNLISMMNGSINVTSEPGKGSAFMVELPFEKAPDQEVIYYLQKQKQESGISAYSEKKYQIFIADDIEENRTVTKDLLKQIFAASKIYTAAHGKELIEQLTDLNGSAKNTCILLDIDMPVMNGFEAVKAIREELKLSIPVFALTASVFIGDEKELKALGFDQIVMKPFVPAELAQKIDSYLSGRKVEKLV